MKVEVDMELVLHAAKAVMTEPNEAAWAIGHALVTKYPRFSALRHRLIDDFVESTEIKIGGTD